MSQSKAAPQLAARGFPGLKPAVADVILAVGLHLVDIVAIGALLLMERRAPHHQPLNEVT